MGINIGSSEIDKINIGGTDVDEVYVGSSKVRPTTPYTPGANTIFYFPFISDADDYSGNGYSLTNSGTQENIGRYFNTQVELDRRPPTAATFTMFWAKVLNVGTKGSGQGNTYNQLPVGYNRGNMNFDIYSNARNWRIEYYYNTSGSTYSYSTGNLLGQWVHVVLASNASTGVWCFVNGVKHTIRSGSNGNDSNTFKVIVNNQTTTPMEVILSDCISETQPRSDADVVAYYNKTKSTYGVS